MTHITGTKQAFPIFESFISQARMHSIWLITLLLYGNGWSADSADRSNASPLASFTNYVQKIPGSTIAFSMVAIPGGTITLGSATNQPRHEPTDAPMKTVTLKPFWMGQYEVTWEEFLPYAVYDRSKIVRFVHKLEGHVDVDGISHPTKAYGDICRGRGEKGYPAIGLGLPAAMEYCRWLSRRTGRPFRLPTEEEWEYACRAGCTNTFFWGDNPNEASRYAWYEESSATDQFAEGTTRPIGSLEPNPFGLYDIAGNVMEWCAPRSLEALHVARGGGFSNSVSQLRCAARMIENEDWNYLDPQSPQSIWWMSAADNLGFRVVQSLDEHDPALADLPDSIVPLNTASNTTSASEVQRTTPRANSRSVPGPDQ